MKNLLLLLATLYSFNGFTQSVYTDSIHFEGSLAEVSSLYKDCGVKDTTVLILILKESSHWTNGQFTDYVVFYPDGKIEIIEEFISNDPSRKKKWKKRKVKKDIKIKFWTLLDSCITQGLFSLNQIDLDKNG